MIISCSGFCPEQNEEYSISVEYANDVDSNRPNLYRRKRIVCDYGCDQLHPCSIQMECPLLEQAPKLKIF